MILMTRSLMCCMKWTDASCHLVGRYYKIKARLLGLADFSLSDIYAPINKTQKIVGWEEAKTLVLAGFRHFDEEFYQLAKRMFDEHRIDAPVQSKKRGGAFCSSSIPSIRPYVMLNFLGKPRDVSTMAHELGHAIHSMLSAGQPLF